MPKKLKSGDIIYISNDPKPGENHEQKGYRPWLVVSEELLNVTTPFVWAVPFTTKAKNFPLTYPWDAKEHNSEVTGYLLCDQLTTLDVKHRQYRLAEQVEVPEEVKDIIAAILGLK